VTNQSAVREAMADTPLAALKVQELLREVRVDYSKTRVIEAAVAAVVDILSGLADEEVGVCFCCFCCRCLLQSTSPYAMSFSLVSSLFCRSRLLLLLHSPGT
jgi:hypothetical protein